MVRRNAVLIARWLHRLFEASLVIKGVLAATESLAGLGLLLTANRQIVALVDWLTRYEIAEDPNDKIASWVARHAELLSIQSQHFYAWYLLSHGGLKLIMVILLALGLVWVYPAAMVVLAGFVTYQVYEWIHTGSPFLLALSGLDLFMIYLIWQEYRAMRAGHPLAEVGRKESKL